jgi:hypothetical protein
MNSNSIFQRLISRPAPFNFASETNRFKVACAVGFFITMYCLKQIEIRLKCFFYNLDNSDNYYLNIFLLIAIFGLLVHLIRTLFNLYKLNARNNNNNNNNNNRRTATSNNNQLSSGSIKISIAIWIVIILYYVVNLNEQPFESTDAILESNQTRDRLDKNLILKNTVELNKFRLELQPQLFKLNKKLKQQNQIDSIKLDKNNDSATSDESTAKINLNIFELILNSYEVSDNHTELFSEIHRLYNFIGDKLTLFVRLEDHKEGGILRVNRNNLTYGQCVLAGFLNTLIIMVLIYFLIKSIVIDSTANRNLSKLFIEIDNKNTTNSSDKNSKYDLADNAVATTGLLIETKSTSNNAKEPINVSKTKLDVSFTAASTSTPLLKPKQLQIQQQQPENDSSTINTEMYSFSNDNTTSNDNNNNNNNLDNNHFNNYDNLNTNLMEEIGFIKWILINYYNTNHQLITEHLNLVNKLFKEETNDQTVSSFFFVNISSRNAFFKKFDSKYEAGKLLIKYFIKKT